MPDPCPCHEPITPGHRCWATEAARMRMLERVAGEYLAALDRTRDGGRLTQDERSARCRAYDVAEAALRSALSALPAGEEDDPAMAESGRDAAHMHEQGASLHPAPPAAVSGEGPTVADIREGERARWAAALRDRASKLEGEDANGTGPNDDKELSVFFWDMADALSNDNPDHLDWVAECRAKQRKHPSPPPPAASEGHDRCTICAGDTHYSIATSGGRMAPVHAGRCEDRLRQSWAYLDSLRPPAASEGSWIMAGCLDCDRDHGPCDDHAALLTRVRAEATAAERSAVVAWLREHAFDSADPIEAGEHRQRAGKDGG